jgi:tetratricopeptide (TPR) repeat protein
MRTGLHIKVALGAITTLVIFFGLKNRLMSVAPLDGEIAFHAGDYGTAAAIAANLRASAQDSDSASRLCETLRLEGDILVAKGEYADAKIKFLRALEIKKSLGNENSFASSFEAIGDCELHLGDTEKALSMFQESLALYSKGRDATGVIMAKRGIASAYSRLGKIQDSLYLLDSCQKLLLSQPVSPGRFALEADLRSRQSIAYCLLGSYQSAISMAQQSLDFWNSQRHPRWMAVCDAQLGFIYQRSGDQLRAKRHLLHAQEAFGKLGDSKSMVAIAQELS